MARDGFRKFTGDTGHTLDWQIGFEDPFYNTHFNFLGIGNKKQDKKEAQVLSDTRAIFPTPSSCSMVTASLPKIRAEIEAIKKKIQADPKGSVVPRYLSAYNIILEEYTNYYNNNCLTAQSSIPSSATAPIANTAVKDPAQQSSTPAALNSSTGTGTATTALANASGAVVAQAKKIPGWVWWTAGGVVLITTIVIIKKSS